MKPAPFEYYAPDSLEAALELKAEHGDEAKVLAGGQSLIPAMNFRVAMPGILVDLNKISNLRFIRKQNGELRIGAMTVQSQAERDPLVESDSPLLYETLPNIAHPQIRNRGTIGGSLAHADPAAELPVVASAMNARLKAKSKDGERWIEVADFFSGFFSVSLQPEEILVEIAWPDLPPNAGWAFLEIARRRGDYAMAGVAAVLSLKENGDCEEARLVYLNVGDGPMVAVEAAKSLKGQKPNDKAFAEAAKIASETEITPFGNVHASPEYQRHLSQVLTQRALSKASERAQATRK